MQAKAMAGADGKMSNGDQAGDLPPPNYGAKYEQHVGTLQKQLDEAKKQCARPPCLHATCRCTLLYAIASTNTADPLHSTTPPCVTGETWWLIGSSEDRWARLKLHA